MTTKEKFMRENTETPSATIQRAFELIKEPSVVDVCVAVHCGKWTRLVWITDVEAVTKEVEFLRATGGVLAAILIVEGFKVRALCLPGIRSRVAKKLLHNFTRAVEGHVETVVLH